MANTAEGFHRNSNKDFMRFLGYSRSSIAETVSHSYVAFDQEYIDEQELEEVKRLADIAWKKINNFISYLNESSKKKRTNWTNETNETNKTNLNQYNKSI